MEKNASDFQLVYMTASSQEEAQKIAEALLNKKLVACANIFAPMQSLYRWESKLESNVEVAVIFKSRRELFKQLEETVLGLHSYSCPCLVALPLAQGHPAFLKWIADSTAELPKNNS